MKKKNLLVIDDDEAIRELLCFWAEEEGLGCEVAVSGEGALKKIRQHNYDLLLIDIKLGGLNGIQTLRKVRALGKKMPVIMMTAFFADDLVKEAKSLGILETDILYKPFDFENLEKLIFRKIGLNK